MTTKPKPLAEMNIRELKAEARKLTGTTKAIRGYSNLAQIQLFSRLRDVWEGSPTVNL